MSNDKTPWLCKEKAALLEDVDFLKKQIEIRRELRSQMVGTLYPSILADEIIYLNGVLSDLIYKRKYSKSK